MRHEVTDPKPCATYGCKDVATELITSRTTERLNEYWVTCVHHTNTVLRFLRERDRGWRLPSDTIKITHLSRVGGGGDPS